MLDVSTELEEGKVRLAPSFSLASVPFSPWSQRFINMTYDYIFASMHFANFEMQ